MGYVGTKPADAALTTSDLGDSIVTAAKLATDAVETAKVKALNITNAKIAAGTIDVTAKITGTVPTTNLGSGTASSTTILYGDQTYKTEPAEYDDDQIQSNIAMLGFYVAVNGSLVRYNLVDQSIDEYFDTSGVDASASTNERRVASGSNYYYEGTASTSPSVTEDADATGTDGDYSWYKWTAAGAGSYVNDTTQDHEYLVVAGGGGGSANNGGGGGAGGLLTATGLSLTGGNTYTPTVGAGAAGASGSQASNGTNSTLAGTGISTLTAVGGGGAGGGGGTCDGADGGSGGGDCYSSTSGGGGAGTEGQGNIGGHGGGAGGDGEAGAGGGGGAGAVGANGTTSVGGNGGIGVASDIIETGTDVWYAGGGGGSVANTDSDGGNQDGGDNGFTKGGGGKGTNTSTTDIDGIANTGGGGGGLDNGTGGTGGLGVIILRRLTSSVGPGGDLTLQSTDVTAEASPTYGEFVTLIENAYGTATLNTDIKGYVSRDSGVTFTQGTLVDEGTWGTNKKILGFHDLTITGSAGTSMCYKIETLNQSAASKETRIYATSIGWK